MSFLDFQHLHGVTQLPLWFPPPAPPGFKLREVEAIDGRGTTRLFYPEI